MAEKTIKWKNLARFLIVFSFETKNKKNYKPKNIEL
jgi:hypothetical protein